MAFHVNTKHLVCSVVLALLGLVALAARAEDQQFPLVAAKECRPRGGVPNFLARARTPGAVVKVAYLGGSITEQPGWRPKSLAYFQRTYPAANFTEINAAIGGTGSDLGVYRLKHDVLDGKPDLLFVEFATNDGGAPSLQIQKCMEGIVRQTWKSLPECDICFVLQAIVRSFKSIADVSQAVAPHTLESPLVTGNYEDARMVPIQEARLSHGFVSLDLKTDKTFKYFATRLSNLYRGAHPGDTITFKFKGTSAAIYDVIGPDSGQVLVTLDDRPPRLISRFDSFCLYYRLAVLPVGSDLPDIPHTVKVEIHPDQPDRMKLLGERARNLDRPERFRGTSFYPGAILIVGKLLK